MFEAIFTRLRGVGGLDARHRSHIHTLLRGPALPASTSAFGLIGLGVLCLAVALFASAPLHAEDKSIIETAKDGGGPGDDGADALAVTVPAGYVPGSQPLPSFAGTGGYLLGESTAGDGHAGRSHHGLAGSGGAGGDGGAGGVINFNLIDTFKSLEDGRPAISAVSHGGVGGDGGHGSGLGAHGGAAGAGGGGGAVSVTLLTGTVVTTALADSQGVLAMSRGGKGANGGGDSGLAGDGGSGGRGGSGGDVTITSNAASITTNGKSAHALAAQSLGSGGGNGEDFAGLGGHGGRGHGGGHGGTVAVTAGNGILKTNAAGAHGIFAQSVGGGGGDGGSAGGIAGLGGDGGAAAPGGEVTVISGGTISTAGKGAYGILAESLGGGGGIAGGGNGIVAIGGNGESSGDGGAVSVTTTATAVIKTTGPEAAGVHLHSIGGGGGVGASGKGFVSVGGKGGRGGDGAGLTANLLGKITTTGDHAQGVLADSIGGGGGRADTSGGSYAIGGSGGAGGNGGAINLNTADGTTASAGITTSGAHASAIELKSVGGGGGSGGGAIAAGVEASVAVGGSGGKGGAGGDIDAHNFGALTTTGHHSDGVYAVSTGGGGGRGGSTVSVAAGAFFAGSAAIGGDGGDGGNGGRVTLVNDGVITTAGSHSRGLSAGSVGDGGGHGGSAISVAAAGGKVAVAVAIGHGGKGGKGGDGDTIDIQNTGRISATGAAFSAGIHAHSAGGGGGSGGSVVDFAAAASSDGSASAGVGIGGKGGAGGNGAAATIVNHTDADVETTGMFSKGLLAQSVGGGGGAGGNVLTGTLAVAKASSISSSVSVGGAGGDGGYGGFTHIVNFGTVTTGDVFSSAIFAHSVGGGGGVGGNADAFSIAFAQPDKGESDGGKTASVSVAVGGRGGKGGDGGASKVENHGTVTTNGHISSGIVAQSVGGGGGLGGHGWSMAASRANNPGRGGSSSGAKPKALAVSVAVGGSGGKGGHGHTAEAINDGEITTNGILSNGVHVQSVGGGGGVGGSVDAVKFGTTPAPAKGKPNSLGVSVSVGGSDGFGGNGGDATLQNHGTVTTTNHLSSGLLAQSIGGGGGVAGHGDGVSVSVTTKNPGVALAIGGAAGGGGNAGTVKITSTAALATSGVHSHGIHAQAIGGGGGTAHTVATTGLIEALTKVVSAADEAAVLNARRKNLDLGLAVGGTGPAGGNGGTIVVDNSGSIHVSGEGSNGILAHSVGGGGGAGSQGSTTNEVSVGIGGRGGSSGHGGKVTVGNSSAITTFGAWGNGITAQSIGGGGGTGGSGNTAPAFSLGMGIAVGGSGGASGNGGTVEVHNSGIISTNADNASGIVAHSIGGGGGIGGAGVNTTITAMAVGGGDGAKGGNGGQVTVDLLDNASITTLGTGAAGVIAQSIGGGGGLGGAGLSGVCTGFDLSPGGKHLEQCKTGKLTTPKDADKVTGNGGNVTVTGTGTAIKTSGAFSHGIVAQSVAGGGGIGSDGQDKASIGSNGGKGKAGDVTVSLSSADSINTTGDHAHGILAQSSGKKITGVITLNIAGRITATGANTYALYSDTAANTTNVTIERSGTVMGGTDQDSAAIRVEGKVGVTNRGNIGAANSTAIDAGKAVTVTNTGTLSGAVEGAAGSLVDNRNGGTFNPTGTSVAISNAGIVDAGGTGAIAQVTAQSFTQSPTGTLQADIDMANAQSDLVVVTASGAKLSGQIAPRLLTMSQGGPQQIVAGSGIDTTGLTVVDTAAVTYQLIKTTTGLSVGVSQVDYAASGMTASQTSAANLYNQSHAGSTNGGLSAAMAHAGNARDVETLAAALDDAHPGNFTTNTHANIESSQQATANLLSCGERDGPFAAIREGECVWAKGLARWLKHDGTLSSQTFRDESYGFAAGGQVAISENWRLGIALQYEDGTLTAGSRYASEEARVHGGLAAKYTAGPWLLAATIGYGRGYADTTRLVNAGYGDAAAKSDPETSIFSSRLRAAYLIEMDEVFIRPQVDLDLWNGRTHAFSETGAGALDIIAGTQDNVGIAITPSLEIGISKTLESGAVLRPFIQAGVTFSDFDADISARLRGADETLGTITGAGAGDDVMARLSAGLNVYAAGDHEIKLRYDGMFGEDTRSHSGSIKFGWAF